MRWNSKAPPDAGNGRYPSSSMMMASFGFMIYAISPAYSNSELEKSEMNNKVELNAPVGTNGVIVG